MSLVLAEFMGTAVLTTFGCGVCANVNLNRSRANVSVLGGGWITITAGWAFAVMLGAFVSNAIGGAGELNPALVLFKVLTGAYTLSTALPIMNLPEPWLEPFLCGWLTCRTGLSPKTKELF